MADRTAPIPRGARHGIDIALACIAGALAVMVMLVGRVVFGEPVIERGETGTAVPSAAQTAPAAQPPAERPGATVQTGTIAPTQRTPQPSDRSGSNRGRG